MELSDVNSLLRETTARFRIFWQSPNPPKATSNRFVSNIKIKTFYESAVDLQSNKNCNDRRSTAVFALMFLYYYRLNVECDTQIFKPSRTVAVKFQVSQLFLRVITRFNPANFYCDFVIRGLSIIINLAIY